MIRLFFVTVFLFALGSQDKAYAGQLSEFNSQIERVNQPYKSALFYLRTGNAGVASLELGGAVQRWGEVVERYGSTPPDPFGDDPNWPATIAAISKAFDESTKHASAGNSEAARLALLQVREHLHALRRRNGIRVLADCIYDLNAQMDVLYHYRHNPPDLTKLPVRNVTKSASAIYAHLLEGCRVQAPEELQGNDDFRSIFGGAAASAGRLFGPIDAQDQTGFVNVLRELKSFDVIIFLRWG